MLATLHIKNIGIIDEITIDFTKGFNILTGETGAGKSLIIDALSIISGGRFSKEMIRKGENYSFVEASIYVNKKPENKIKNISPEHIVPEQEGEANGDEQEDVHDEPENIIVSREIYENGRNTCKINGRMVTVSELKEVMTNIINIHGQNDSQNLLNEDNHIIYLDKFIGANVEKILKLYAEKYSEYLNIKRELKKNYGDDKERQRKLDILKYQYNEIEESGLKLSEDEELEKKKKIMSNAEKIVTSLNEANVQINDNALNSISIAISKLEKIEDLNVKYSKVLNSLKSNYYDLQEIAIDIGHLDDGMDFNEEDRNQLEIRLDTINDLKRKYGNTIEEILKYQEEVKEEIERIENLEEINQKLKERQLKLEEELLKYGEEIHALREKFASELSKKINKELQDLEMINATFSIKIEKIGLNPNGLDKIEFIISTNKGEDFKPLVKIASGGEMSRIMLAIKTVLSNVDDVPVLVFDEIDTGISGKAAKAVGEKLKKISKEHQVIVVTHLASIAAKGDTNFYIYKIIENEKTKTKIKELDEEEVIREIARIASGEITEISLEHAKELRKAS